MARVLVANITVPLDHYTVLKNDSGWKDSVRSQLCTMIAEAILEAGAATITTYQVPYSPNAPFGEQIVKAVISVNLPQASSQGVRYDTYTRSP